MGHISSVFANEDEARSAWEERRDEIMDSWMNRTTGDRPWGWWAFEAGRPPHLQPLRPGKWKSSEEIDEYYIEPVRWLAAHGLREDEIAEIKRRADEARPRIGTPAEQYSTDIDRQDRRKAKLWEAVKQAKN